MLTFYSPPPWLTQRVAGRHRVNKRLDAGDWCANFRLFGNEEGGRPGGLVDRPNLAHDTSFKDARAQPVKIPFAKP